jgi:predicted metalloprotease with PDZ domain
MSGGRITLDDYMKLLWQQHGKPGGPAPGIVAKPYTLRDLREHLATLSGNRKFADDFFDKYVEGREAPDYARLLALAGYSLQMAPIGKGWIGNILISESPNGLAVGGAGARPYPVPFNMPIYEAGIDSGDIIKTIDGVPATLVGWNTIATRKPGEVVSVGVMRRGGTVVVKTITVKQDPTALSVIPVESMPGGSLTPAQKSFRDAWISTRVN